MMDLVNCITIIFSKKYDALPCMMLYFYIFSMYEYLCVCIHNISVYWLHRYRIYIPRYIKKLPLEIGCELHKVHIWSRSPSKLFGQKAINPGLW